MSAPATADTYTAQGGPGPAPDLLVDIEHPTTIDPVELLASALVVADDEGFEEEPIDQPCLPGLLRTCLVCGELEGSRFTSYDCAFVQHEVDAV